MRHSLFAFFTGAAVAVTIATTAHAQRAIDIAIDPARDNAPISPYIYGINWVHGGEELHADWNLGSRRLGGNRLTSYNWEINASNSGNDCEAECKDQNDDWLTYQLPAADQAMPALLPRRFHEDSKALGCYSLVQLPTAGYVAADRNEDVRPVPPAPSPRWKEVRFHKETPYAATPDVNDAYVYTDEEVNYLVTAFGRGSEGGVQGYAIDNEPGLWYSSHPRLRGLSYISAEEVTQAEENNPLLVKDAKAGCAELIAKSTELAKGVKGVDPSAEIIGPAYWGFLDYYSLQGAPDWMNYSATYGTYLEMYLAGMRAASDQAGKRLLDVVDVHWYPQMEETPEAIMQAPRSLWDPTYKEDSWITRDVLGGPVNLIGTFRKAIDERYPDTKLAITEFRFGDADNGDHYYSGIAVADALGIYGRYGVYMAHYHPTDLAAPIAGYVAAAYKIFRNYDGAKSTFGSTAVHAATSDVAASSAYASVESEEKGKLHLILINKSRTETLDARVAIAGSKSYTSGHVYAFDNTSSAITERTPIASIANNAFTYRLAPLTVAHVVLEGAASGTEGIEARSGMSLAVTGANPFDRGTSLRFTLPSRERATVKLFNALGEEIATLADGMFAEGEHLVGIDGNGLSAGAYYCRLVAGEEVKVVEVRVVR